MLNGPPNRIATVQGALRPMCELCPIVETYTSNRLCLKHLSAVTDMMEGGFGSLFKVTVGLLLLVLCYVSANEQSLAESLNFAGQRLNALTHRVLSLSNKLDDVLAARENAEFHGKRLTKKLDRHQGSVVLRGFCHLL